MRNVLIQVDFTYDYDEEEIREKASGNLPTVQQTQGLLWKIWTHNPEESRAGSINCFASREDAETYRAGPIGKQLESDPNIRDVSMKLFDVMEDPSRRTRAPVFEE